MLRPHGDTRVVLRSGAASRHTVVVARAAELAAPSRVVLPAAEAPPGLILPDGSINWGCPCLGGMATGPCGVHFRAAFSCFHYSDADPKGSDCYEKFSEMQSCMARYPELYARDDDDDMPAPPGTPTAPPDTSTAPPGTPTAPPDTSTAPPGTSTAPPDILAPPPETLARAE